jgi:hypothetical protein
MLESFLHAKKVSKVPARTQAEITQSIHVVAIKYRLATHYEYCLVCRFNDSTI